MQGLKMLWNRPMTSLLLAALCLALPFNAPALFFLTPIGAVLLVYSALKMTDTAEPRRMFRRGFGFGFFYHLLIYHWLLSLHPLSAAGLSGVVSVFIVLLAAVGASAIHACFFGLGFWVFGRLSRRARGAGWRAPLFCATFLLCEALTSVGTLAFPWARMSLPLIEVPTLVSTAALVGPWGVELGLLFFGALCALAFRARARRRILAICLAAFLLLTNLLFGLLYRPQDTEQTLRIAAVQTNYSSQDKWSTSSAALRENCRRLARAAAEEGAEVIVFPESVLASRLVRGDQNEAFFAELSEECDALIVAGCIYAEGADTYNAVCVFDSTGLCSFNAKRHLVPFGEYLPWQDVLKVVLPAVGNMSYYRNDYTVGEGGIAGEGLGLTFGGLVCFDTLFTELSAESAREGADLLFAPTNDAWFKESGAARQHLWHGAWRALETGRGLVQAANVGISAVVDPRGCVLDGVELATEDVAVADVPLAAVDTPYVHTGDLAVPLSALLLALGLVRLVLERRAQKRTEEARR